MLASLANGYCALWAASAPLCNSKPAGSGLRTQEEASIETDSAKIAAMGGLAPRYALVAAVAITSRRSISPTRVISHQVNVEGAIQNTSRLSAVHESDPVEAVEGVEKETGIRWRSTLSRAIQALPSSRTITKAWLARSNKPKLAIGHVQRGQGTAQEVPKKIQPRECYHR
jgi:hypothetical protein